jgi:hypothetical protein
VSACGESSRAPAPRASASAPRAAEPHRPKHQPLVDETVPIPAGSFFAGSVPGEPGRRPELEPRRYTVELGPFEIDRLPYPNDPARAPLTNVTRERAAALCAERGARLCTELEWERACKGPSSNTYASGADWDPRCAETPAQCASAFDVLALGMAFQEWTASDVGKSEDQPRQGAAVRGATARAAALLHRCAARTVINPQEANGELAFRCCKGPPNAARIEEPPRGTTFEKTKLTVERLKQLLDADARTRDLGKDLKYFREPDAAATVVSRGPGDKKGFQFTVAPLSWRPTAGAEYLLVSARSGETTSFVVAYYVVAADEFRLASSFVMKNEPGPVAFAYSPDIRPRLHFSTCWGCPGETGKILHRRPDEVVLLQP